MDKPPQRPEATLLRRARKAAGRRIPAVAAEAGVSPSWWSQVENSAVARDGAYLPVKAEAGTFAHMAYAVGITPERLETEGERPDAAEILREVIAWKAGQDKYPPGEAPPPDPNAVKPPDADGFVRPAYVGWMEAQALETEGKFRLLHHRDVHNIVTAAAQRSQEQAAELERKRELEAEVRHLRGVTNGS